jgi:hypothetical protein
MRMRLWAVTLSIAAAAVAPRAARAGTWQPREEPRYVSRLVLGVSSGYAYGLGDIDSSTALQDAVGFQVPVQLDIGWRFHPEFSVGVYGAYGFSRPTGAMKASCDQNDLSCSANTIRAGVQLVRYFPSAPSESSPVWNDPSRRDVLNSAWLGVGLGYESITVGIGNVDLTATGYEASAQGGVNLHETPSSSLGLFVAVSVARFTYLKSAVASGSLSEQRLHEWITIGLRAEFSR